MKCHQCLLTARSLILIVSLIPIFPQKKQLRRAVEDMSPLLRTLTLDRIAVRCWLQCVMAALFRVSFQICGKSHNASLLAAGSYKLRAKYANLKMGIISTQYQP